MRRRSAPAAAIAAARSASDEMLQATSLVAAAATLSNPTSLPPLPDSSDVDSHAAADTGAPAAAVSQVDRPASLKSSDNPHVIAVFVCAYGKTAVTLGHWFLPHLYFHH